MKDRLANLPLPLLFATLASLLFLPACTPNGLIQRWVEPEEPARKMMLKNLDAVVNHDGRRLPTGTELTGTVVLVETGGVEKPLVCMGVLERRCLDFRRGDEILLNEVMLRQGVLRLNGRDYQDYWLAVDRRGVRRSMR